MKVINDILGNQYRLTDERWAHITANHPELSKRKSDLADCLLSPDVIVKSANDSFVLIYQKQEKSKYFMAVVAHRSKQFIITAFITDKIKLGKILWQK